MVDQRGYVYFIEWNQPGIVKIGHAGNLKKRIFTHKTYIPDLILLRYIKCESPSLAKMLERHIHAFFKFAHRDHEFFFLPEFACDEGAGLLIHKLLSETLGLAYHIPATWTGGETEGLRENLALYAEEDPRYWCATKPVPRAPEYIRSERLRARYQDPKYRAAALQHALENLTKIQKDPQIRQASAKRMREANRDPAFQQKARAGRMRSYQTTRMRTKHHPGQQELF